MLTITEVRFINLLITRLQLCFHAKELELANWYYQAAIRDRKLPEEKFLGRAGDVIIWHEQLVHGGSPILNLNKTRKSLVFHYWRAAEMEPSTLLPYREGFYMNRPHPTV